MEPKAKFNLKHSGVKRIMQEIKELESQPASQFIAKALEEDVFEWHFVMRGPPDTDFEGGIYHGRILLPADYPFKPPSFMMLTPSGRFQTNTKICLSISSHHPENWQPSWSVRTALTALIAFMPTPGAGAVGSLDFPSEDRKALAVRSRCEIPKFGSVERQRLINEMHQLVLDMELREAEGTAVPGPDEGPTALNTDPEVTPREAPIPEVANDMPALHTRVADIPATPETKTWTPEAIPQPAPPALVPVTPATTRVGSSNLARTISANVQPTQSAADRGLAALAVALSVAIAAILLKKVVLFMLVDPTGFST